MPTTTDMEGTETRPAFGLTPDEDEELRRLHAMAEFGSVAVHLRDRYLELRRRDRRIEVREPATEVVVEAVHGEDDVE